MNVHIMTHTTQVMNVHTMMHTTQVMNVHTMTHTTQEHLAQIILSVFHIETYLKPHI
jgi:hypothetical protein